MISSARADSEGGFQQGLFGRSIKGRDLGDAVHQRLIIQPRHAVPINRIALNFSKLARFLFQRPAGCDVQTPPRSGSAGFPPRPAGRASAHRARARSGTGLPLQYDVVAPIIQRLDMVDPADTANLKQVRRSLAPVARGWIIAMRRSRAIASETMARYRGSKICSGRRRRGNRIAPGRGKTERRVSVPVVIRTGSQTICAAWPQPRDLPAR
jgi:hypothetical protein